MVAWLTYPGLTRERFTNTAKITWRAQPAKIVLHSTEGNTYPSASVYRDGASAPHFTIDVRGRTCRQHYPLTEGAWALQAPTGISTNSYGVIQIEMIGTCAGTPGIQSVLAYNDNDLLYLGGLLKTIADETGIPLTTGVEFMKYPDSYGKTRVRLTTAQWYAYRGILGHQHVPGNTHGDPGNFPIARLLDLITPPPEDDMPTADEIRHAVWQTPVFDNPDGSKVPAWKALSDAYRLAQENNRLLGVILTWRPPAPGTPEAEGLRLLREPDPQPIAEAVVAAVDEQVTRLAQPEQGHD